MSQYSGGVRDTQKHKKISSSLMRIDHRVFQEPCPIGRPWKITLAVSGGFHVKITVHGFKNLFNLFAINDLCKFSLFFSSGQFFEN